MRTVTRLLAVLAFGLIATGLVLGFMPTGNGGCGAAFSSGKSYTAECADIRANRRSLPITLLGLGLTFGVASLVANEERSSA